MLNNQRRPLLKPSEKGGARSSVALSRQRKTSRYEVLKDKIRSWWNDRLKIGEALREIRDEQLYKTEYSSFEEFCTDEFNLKHSQAYGLIAAVGVKESLKPSAMADKITNERQARALAAVPEEKRVEVLTAAAKAPGPVTAKRITEAAKSNGHARAEAQNEWLDKTGCLIPADVYEDWQAAESFSDLLRDLHRIKLRVEKGLEDGELAFRELTNSTVAELTNVWGDLQRLIPYALCPTCQGHGRKKCTLCKQRGFISKFGYEHWIPKTAREIREKAKKR